MNPEKSDHISAARIGARASIAVAVIAAVAAIIVAIVGKSPKPDGSNPNPSYATNQNNINSNQSSVVNGNVRSVFLARNNNEATTPAPTPPDKFVRTVGDVEYELAEARFEGNNLYFWFLAINQGANKEICLRFSSSLTDEGGNPHQQRYRTAGREKGSFDCFFVNLPNNVPTRFGLIFDSVSPMAKRIPFLRVELQKEGAIELNNIPVPYKRMHST